MIRSFGDKRTEALFADAFVKEFQGFARGAKRKLETINAAANLTDLTMLLRTGWRNCVVD